MLKILTKEQKLNIINTLLSTGGEFAEVFMEDTYNEAIDMFSGKVSNMGANTTSGAALRIIKDNVEVNESISSFDYEVLLEKALELSKSFEGERVLSIDHFDIPEKVNHVCIKRETDGTYQEELSIMNDVTKYALEYDKRIIQVRSIFTKKLQDMNVFSSDNVDVCDKRSNIRLSLMVVAKEEDNMQTSFRSYGRNMGMEMFDEFDRKEFATHVAKNAILMLSAIDMPGGDMPVVIHNGFGGVILHEACVHGLEATAVAKGLSVFCNKLNTQIASPIVNAVDEGVTLGEWGSINYDDEGTPVQYRKLIENGILKTYLVDKRNSKKMNHPITGSSRRQSYKFPTTSRMTNTYFLPGNDKFEDIIKSVKYGLFAEEMGGGSVNPSTGEFNFGVNVGYLIEDGKITKPVKGATLVGSGAEILMNIEMISDNLTQAQGMCGSYSGSVPTNVGQPTIKVSHITVGGAGKAGK